MRGRVLAPAALTASILSGCSGSTGTPEMVDQTPPPRSEFLGPIPDDFRNTRTPTEFQAGADQLALAWGNTMRTLRLGEMGASLTRDGDGAQDLLPDVNRCGNLGGAIGGALRPSDIDRVPHSFALTNASTTTCSAALETLGSTFVNATSALIHQASGLAKPALTQDRCTASDIAGFQSARAAVGVEFIRLVGDNDLYLTRFDVPYFVARYEGGSDGQRTALRAEAEWNATHPEASGAEWRSYQWSGAASFAEGSTVKIQKGDRLDVRRVENGAIVSDRSLLRKSLVTLTTGDQPSLTEETTFTRWEGLSEHAWSLVLHVATAPSGNGINVRIERRDGETTLSQAMTLTTDGVGGCTAAVAP